LRPLPRSSRSPPWSIPRRFLTLHTLFELLWQRAETLTEDAGPAAARSMASDREVLNLLRAGLTDRAAARQLGVAERTVQRRMQRIMAEYGVRTRFQLGLQLRGHQAS